MAYGIRAGGSLLSRGMPAREDFLSLAPSLSFFLSLLTKNIFRSDKTIIVALMARDGEDGGE